MTRRTLLAVLGALVLGLSAPLVAHHSVSAEFDTSKQITFTGTVTKVEWTNPHIYTHVETKGPDGKTITYHVEGGAPNALFRQGWRKETIKVGETVTVTGAPAKSPTSPNIGVATITMSDGRRLYGGGGPNAGRGAAQ